MAIPWKVPARRSLLLLGLTLLKPIHPIGGREREGAGERNISFSLSKIKVPNIVITVAAQS